MHHDDCRHLLDDLSAYLDGEASAALCAEIERQAAECEDCRAIVDTMRQTIRLYRTQPPPLYPAEARRRLYKSLDLAPFLGSDPS